MPLSSRPAAPTDSAQSCRTPPSVLRSAQPLRVSAIVPARNEALCINAVIQGLLQLRTPAGQPLIFEVLVADNGSTDATGLVARHAGATVIEVPRPGYGQACWAAVQASHGDVLLFVDGDGAADPQDAPALLAPIEDAIEGAVDLVIGLRQRPDAGAMSPPQRFGNALACALMRWIWRMPATDLGPYRAIRRAAFDALDMQDRSFGWTVEMQVRAHVLGLRVAQVPVRWHARTAGVSKISGTLRGVFGAGVGILGMIARLWWRERQRPARASSNLVFSHPTEGAVHESKEF
jgi:glycosyltransferase involved in cell wall biosynthesis